VRRLGLAGAHLVVAVSGGPDSIALALGLAELARDLDLRLHLAHLDHRLRAGSGEDATFVAELARHLRLPSTIESVEVAALARSRGEGLEEAGRHARYRFLARIREEVAADAVAVGHTADDQTETRLLHLARGSGLRGLVGMAEDSRVPVPGGSAVRVVRPLLGVTRAETVRFGQVRGVGARLDPSNFDRSFARNRMRADVVPALRTINPRVDAALDRLARAAADAEDVVEAELDRRIEGAVAVSEGCWRLKRATWTALPAALRRAALRRAGEAVRREGSAELDAAAIERGLAAADGHAGRALDWPGGRRLRVERDGIVVEVTPAADPSPPAERVVRSDGPLPIRDLPESLRLGESASLRSRPRIGRCGRADRRHVDLDRTKLGDRPLVVRARRPGDWLAPEGMTGRKKLQDLLVDTGVPRSQRDRVPLVAAGSDLVWVVGLRRDRRFLADANSRDVLCLTVDEPPTDVDEEDALCRTSPMT
jgi:tRNA(Ile)-lysidine synthase